MRTVNGKLITEGKQQLDTIKNNAANIMQNHQDLEAQIADISQQNLKYSQEINIINSHLTKLDKRCILLEESITRQFIQFIVINICSAIGLAYLWFSFHPNSQVPTKPASSAMIESTQQPAKQCG